MKWHAVTANRDYGTLYESGPYSIRHYTEKKPVGFGISCARAYLDGEQIGEWTGKAALDLAMQACGRRANPIPECDFIPGKGVHR